MHPQCAELTRGGRCEKHKRVISQAVDAQRGSRHERGYTSKWASASRGFLQSVAADQMARVASGELALPAGCPGFPLCQCDECDEGRTRALLATVTDHHVPHRGDMKLFWDRGNWRALAKSCHDAKTAREDGGFGNPRASAPRAS
jgi:5-methylcytosine-specific restriction protein A